jgi:hypothetical protein
MGWPISAAFFSAAAMMRRASASWIIDAPCFGFSGFDVGERNVVRAFQPSPILATILLSRRWAPARR